MITALQGDRVQDAVRTKVVQLAAVLSPRRLYAAPLGYRPSFSCSGECHHIHFVLAGFVGVVRNPVAIGRELCLVDIAGWRLSYENGLPAVREGNRYKISRATRPAQHILSVLRHIVEDE